MKLHCKVVNLVFCAPQGRSVVGYNSVFGITSQGAPAERSEDRVPPLVGHYSAKILSREAVSKPLKCSSVLLMSINL